MADTRQKKETVERSYQLALMKRNDHGLVHWLPKMLL